MDEQKHLSIYTHSFKIGFYTGIVLILFFLLLYLTDDLVGNKILPNLAFLILGISIVYYTIMCRNNVLGGYITFGKSFKHGFLITIFSSLLLAIFYYLLFQFFDPNLLTETKLAAEQQLYESLIKSGVPEDQIDSTIEMSLQFTNPIMLAVGTFFNYLFTGGVISLIAAAFIKKSKPLFPETNE